MNGDVSEGESPLDTDSSEDMNMAPHNSSPPPPPPSKYTSREDMVRIRCSLKWTSEWGSSMQAPTPDLLMKYWVESNGVSSANSPVILSPPLSSPPFPLSSPLLLYKLFVKPLNWRGCEFVLITSCPYYSTSPIVLEGQYLRLWQRRAAFSPIPTMATKLLPGNIKLLCGMNTQPKRGREGNKANKQIVRNHMALPL